MQKLQEHPEKVEEDPNENDRINESSDEDEDKKSEEIKKEEADGVINLGLKQESPNSKINVELIPKGLDLDKEEESSNLNKDGNESDGNPDEEEREGEKKEEIKKKEKDIDEYYAELRKNFAEKNSQWEDPEFGDDRNFYNNKEGQTILRDEIELDPIRPPTMVKNKEGDNFNKFCYIEHTSTNIDYEFVIKRGSIDDKNFLNAAIMLFRRREEYFQNLLLDKEHIVENMNAGFCGFTFFINGEWKKVTIDNRIYGGGDQSDGNAALSNVTTQSTYWLSLFEKAYAKAFGTYEVLTSSSICDYLVDFTGGWARMKEFSFKKEADRNEAEKKEIKALFDEIVKNLNQKNLIGCINYDETKNDEANSDDEDEQMQGDEQIISNSMYIILDAQEYNGVKLIYLVNHWIKGKWTQAYSVDDENWEANKALAEKLHYTVSQTDKTFWMDLQDWAGYFNRLYYCRIFPDSWSQYCIDGRWSELTSGGSPPKCGVPWYPEKVLQSTKGNAGVLQNSRGPSSVISSTLVKSKKTTGLQFKKTTTKGQGTKAGLASINEEKGSKGNSMAGQSGLKSGFKSGLKSGLAGTKKTTTTQTNLGGIDAKDIKTKKPIKEFKKEIRELIKRNAQVDTEDRWFLNPQYKLEIGPKTKLIISLMQEDKKLQNDQYLKTSLMIIHSKGRNSRVWDIDENKVVYGLDKIKDIVKEDDKDKDKNKLQIEDKEEEKIEREIIIQLEYLQILKLLNEKRKKKIQRGEVIHLNLIPYLDYTAKYTVEKQGKSSVTFKPHTVEAVFWLRIFASNNIYISELPQPYNCKIDSFWNVDDEFTAGGARCLVEDKAVKIVTENATWPINPQYLVTFEKNIKMKIILRKTKGSGKGEGEGSKIGFLICKPDVSDEENLNLKQKKKNAEQPTKAFSKTAPFAMGSVGQLGEDSPEIMEKTAKPQYNIKLEQIQKVMESTKRILENNRNNMEGLCPKMFINASEYVIESSYNNTYCACLSLNFNRIDSPIILIPTLDYQKIQFGFEINIYSNQEAFIYSLNIPSYQLLTGEWNNQLCGGCHLSQDEKKKGRGVVTYNEDLTWYDNPKYSLVFDKPETLNDVEFEICLSRSDIIWKPIIAKGVVNSMIGIYLFENDVTGWKEKIVNEKTIDFFPKNHISITFKVDKVPSRGYIIMPVTYGKGVRGPFLIMVKCNASFKFKEMDNTFQ